MEILVKPKQLTSAETSALILAFDADLVVGIGSKGWVRVHSRSKNVAALMTQAATRAEIARFEPNYALLLASPPPKYPDDFYQTYDTMDGGLWGLTKINAPQAWTYTTGVASDLVKGPLGTVVGVIDTGTFPRYSGPHPDLVQNMWSAPKDFCVCVGGTSFNCNGCGISPDIGTPISCPKGSQGWDEYVWNHGEPTDPNGPVPKGTIRCSNIYDDYNHGTHVAGIIGARGNNNTARPSNNNIAVPNSVVGVNWTASMMDLKIWGFAPSSATVMSDAINAIAFAEGVKAFFANQTTPDGVPAPVNVRVLSNSYVIAGDGDSDSFRNEVNNANANGMLFVAAAGNLGLDNDLSYAYQFPANYGAGYPYNGCPPPPSVPTCDTAPNVISVLNTDQNDYLNYSSDYGKNTVHLGAPGTNIWSTWVDTSCTGLADTRYCHETGTSMSTPFVSGTALLLLSRCSLATAGVKSMILNNVDLLSSLAGLTITTGKVNPGTTGGRLNAYNAIRACAAQRPYLAETDANGDSYGDLFIYDPSSGNEYTMLSTGNGSFSTVRNTNLSPSYTWLLRGDFNGDHFADLYAYNLGSGMSAVGLSNASGSTSVTTLQISTGYDVIKTGDFNGDGMTDIVLYNSSNGTMYIGLSNGSASSFPIPLPYVYTLVSSGYTSMVVGDFNRDGYADIFLYNKNTGAGSLGLGNGTGAFPITNCTTYTPGCFFSFDLGGNYDQAVSGDINGDGMADLVIYNQLTGTLYVGIAYFDANGNFAFNWVYNFVSPAYTTVALADFNGDGLGDLLLYNSGTGTEYPGIGNGSGTNFNFTYMLWSPGIDTVSVQDLNGDGMQDVLSYRRSDGTAWAGISTGRNFNFTYNLFGSRLIAR